ncbi:DUF732 domain-containing protein [Rhodococcus sp. NPDC058481]|uniref:DUF732 domain-containing protein n=1 Tax=unclassified Rhodococcus (in: high G+C Gram-positive bacteria) TaxID=192944 RepID=UPI00364DF80C
MGCEGCGRVVSVIGGYCRDCARNVPTAAAAWSARDLREAERRNQAKKDAEPRKRAAMTPEEPKRERVTAARVTVIGGLVAAAIAVAILLGWPDTQDKPPAATEGQNAAMREATGFTESEISTQAAESAYMVAIDREGIQYGSREGVIELGKTACESLTIATNQGLDKQTAKLGLAEQYADAGTITYRQALTIVSAAASTFCPQHKGGY